MKNNNQKLLIVIIILAIIVVGGYVYFSGNKDVRSLGTLVSLNSGNNPVSIADSKISNIAISASQKNEIENLLKSVNQIKLDTRILQDPGFLSLVDTTLFLPDTAVTGRINPFATSGALDAVSPVTTQIVP